MKHKSRWRDLVVEMGIRLYSDARMVTRFQEILIASFKEWSPKDLSGFYRSRSGHSLVEKSDPERLIYFYPPSNSGFDLNM